MKYLLLPALCTLFLLYSPLCAGTQPPVSRPTTQPAWKLTWSDEFDGIKIDRTKWAFEKGNDLYVPEAAMAVAGWGNGEEEYYTDNLRNAFVEDGMLHIRAIREDGGNIRFTSARLTTKGLFQQKFGRFEFRARLPVGKGVWPALWLLPADNHYGGWASSGEIDVMELRGAEPEKVLGTIHFGAHWPANAQDSTTFPLRAGQSASDFHVYAVEWDASAIRFFFDEHCYATKTKWWSSSKTNAQHQGVPPKDASERNPFPAPFDQPFNVIMNVAVGGQFGGPSDRETKFPAEMVIDYVRVYTKKG